MRLPLTGAEATPPPGEPGAIDPRELRDALTVLDWIGAVLVLALGAALTAFPFAVGQPLAELYAEFGVIAVPALTAVATSIGAPLALAAVVFGSLAALLPARLGLGKRRLALVLGFAFGLVALVALALAAYAPLFEQAGEVRREAW